MGGSSGLRAALRGAFNRLPVKVRLALLHRAGRFAPWELGFDFSPPPLGDGEITGAPDFVGIGVQKAGTTWWHELLLHHPQIASRPDLHKERHFFDRFGAEPFGPSDVAAYHGWFPRRPGEVTGEWTPDYFSLPWVPALLRQAAPEARLLVLLRDPVERFWSGLNHQVRAGRPRDGLAVADAVSRGFYEQALATWQRSFEPSQVCVLQYERCTAEPGRQLSRTFAFIGVPDLELDDFGARTSGPSSGDHGPVRHKDVDRRLVELYEPDVVALAARLPDLDLTLWPNFAYLAGNPSAAPAVSPVSSPTRRP